MPASRLDFNDLKARVSCRDAMHQLFHLEPLKGQPPDRYPCPWRPGSNSGAFSVKDSEWYDHVEKVGGSVLDLVARVQHEGDLDAAAKAIAEHFHLHPAAPAKAPATPRAKLGPPDKVYDYHNLAGELVFQVCRYHAKPPERPKKEFRQRVPNGEGGFTWSLAGIETVLYRWPQWHTATHIALAEGEKDADTLTLLGQQGTTMPMGAGKWAPQYTKALAGKHVAIFADRDEVGLAHARKVATELHAADCIVKLVLAPAPHKDITDWYTAFVATCDLGDDLAAATIECQALIDGADVFQPSTQEAAAAPADPKDPLALAKRANLLPFANYYLHDMPQRGAAKIKQEKRPRLVEDMLKDLFLRFHGFPATVGNALFDHDHDTKTIYFMHTPSDMIAWVNEKSHHPVNWTRGIEGCVTYEQFFSATLKNARKYLSISDVPSWPTSADVYYTHGKLPDADPRCEALNEFCAFFNLSSPEDQIFLRALIASCIYCKPGAARPLWLIDSDCGQGAGKTTLANYVARLFGATLDSQTPYLLTGSQLEEGHDRIWRGLLSTGGRQKRIILLDNLSSSRFKSDELASLSTNATLTAMPPYGHSVETRKNDLTVLITANSVSVNKDIADRCIPITLTKHDSNPFWSTRLEQFLAENRLQVIADVLGILDRGATFTPQTRDRYPDWMREVLAPFCKDQATMDTCWLRVLDQRQASDSDLEEAEIIRDHFIRNLNSIGADTADKSVWISSELAIYWAEKTLPGWKNFGRNSVIQKLKTYARTGSIPELAIPAGRRLQEKWPHHGDRRFRGVFWHMAKKEEGVLILTIDDDHNPKVVLV